MARNRNRSRQAKQHSYNVTEGPKIQRSSFKRSSNLKTTMDAGLLVPVFADEVLPGDTWNMRPQVFARLATPITAVMDDIYLDLHWWFVPYRLIWTNFQKFMGEQANPGDPIDYTVPQITPVAGGYTEQSLGDYLGLPTKVDGISTSSLPFRAYALIYNEWYRAQEIQNSIPFDMGDGPDDPTLYPFPYRRNKRHDYFTAALTAPQRGDPVELPLGSTAPVVSAGDGQPTFDSDNVVNSGLQLLGSFGYVATEDIPTASPPQPMVWNDPKLEVDLGAATAATVNSIRQAFQVQKLLERDARGGTRYDEILRSHFGVTPQDGRLDRPEYLGGSTTPVIVSPVPQTSSSENQPTPQGNIAAYGTAFGGGRGFVRNFTEHGVVLGIMSARCPYTYQQGIERWWSRQTRYDFHWPVLSHLGEQEIKRKELFCDGTAADEDTFGFQERYSEYRHKLNRVTGRFRSNAAQPLHQWHFAEVFDNTVALNNDFIIEDPPIDRAIAVTDEPHFIVDAHFGLITARPLPMFGTPGLIDHF